MIGHCFLSICDAANNEFIISKLHMSIKFQWIGDSINVQRKIIALNIFPLKKKSHMSLSKLIIHKEFVDF